MTGPALPRKLTAPGRAETFHVKVVKVADLPQDPAQHPTEHLGVAMYCIVVEMHSGLGNTELQDIFVFNKGFFFHRIWKSVDFLHKEEFLHF